jgi:hypothetical protein
MLGPPKLRRLGEPIAVSLEGLIPQDNFYRHVRPDTGHRIAAAGG